jgi:hypothetical protein
MTGMWARPEGEVRSEDRVMVMVISWCRRVANKNPPKKNHLKKTTKNGIFIFLF